MFVDHCRNLCMFDLNGVSGVFKFARLPKGCKCLLTIVDIFFQTYLVCLFLLSVASVYSIIYICYIYMVRSDRKMYALATVKMSIFKSLVNIYKFCVTIGNYTYFMARLYICCQVGTMSVYDLDL